ncbi:MAG: hypothetical protein RL032_1101 [Pseudomonadota bacterium]
MARIVHGGGMLTLAKLVAPEERAAARRLAQRSERYGVTVIVFCDPALFARWMAIQAGLGSQHSLRQTPERA